MTENFIRNRFWLVFITILICACLTPTQFQKGGINNTLVILIPISALALAYFYAFFLKNIPALERIIIPLILWPVVYLVITFVTEGALDRIFDDYEFGVTQTRATTVVVNLFYYSLISLPILGLTRIYSKIFRYPVSQNNSASKKV